VVQPQRQQPLEQATPTSRPDIFSQLPPGMSVNDYIRILDLGSELPTAAAFIERRHAALVEGSGGGAPGLQPGPAPSSSGYRPNGEQGQNPQRRPGTQQQQQQPPQPPPPPQIQPQQQQQQQQQQQVVSVSPPSANTFGLVEHPTRPNAEARRMFLQMGKQSRAGDDAGPGPSSDPVPASSSVVVVQPKQRRWEVPKHDAHGPSFMFAQHALSDSLVAPQQVAPQTAMQRARAEAEKFFDDDDDVAGGGGGPSWNRGGDNHVQAVMYGGDGQQPQLRHNGPLRRNGVPMPSANNVSPQKKR
jgi:hypothetical protein